MHNRAGMNGLPERWVDIMPSRKQSLASLQVYSWERFLSIATKTNRVSHDGLGRGDANGRSEENKDIKMYKPRALRWLNTKPLARKSLLKVLDKEENFCFSPYSYTLRGMYKLTLFEKFNEEIELLL